MSLPIVTGKGFLLSDGVELQYGKSGVAYARLPLIFKNQRRDDNGKWYHDKEVKIEATVFGELAEALVEVVDGRTDLNVSGELYTEDWEDKEGNTRTSIRMNVHSVWPAKTGSRAPVATGAKADADEPWPF